MTVLSLLFLLLISLSWETNSGWWLTCVEAVEMLSEDSIWVDFDHEVELWPFCGELRGCSQVPIHRRVRPHNVCVWDNLFTVLYQVFKIILNWVFLTFYERSEVDMFSYRHMHDSPWWHFQSEHVAVVVDFIFRHQHTVSIKWSWKQYFCC